MNHMFKLSALAATLFAACLSGQANAAERSGKEVVNSMPGPTVCSSAITTRCKA